MKIILYFVIIWLAIIGKSVLAVELECVGVENGVNSMTGKRRVTPISYHIEIMKDSAKIKELGQVYFSVHENRMSYLLKASIDRKQKYHNRSGILGEYTLLIDKQSGVFEGKSWLFSPNNIVTQKGRCKRIDDGKGDINLGSHQKS